MEVLLREDVENLGQIGEVVDVADGYARNYLLPRRLAVEVTESNLNEVKQAQKARQKRDQEELERVEDVAQDLKGLECAVYAKATEEGHLFGSVGAAKIADALVANGFESVRPANIVITRPFEETGEYEVDVMLHPDVQVTITVEVVARDESEQMEEI
ncbi:MAG: 50S ribosomal protein L9 [Candidatus Brocadiia bacterium]